MAWGKEGSPHEWRPIERQGGTLIRLGKGKEREEYFGFITWGWEKLTFQGQNVIPHRMAVCQVGIAYLWNNCVLLFALFAKMSSKYHEGKERVFADWKAEKRLFCRCRSCFPSNPEQFVSPSRCSHWGRNVAVTHTRLHTDGRANYICNDCGDFFNAFWMFWCCSSSSSTLHAAVAL